jgi:hypothetical protein
MTPHTRSLRSLRAILLALSGPVLLSVPLCAATITGGMTTVTVDPGTLATLTGAGFTLAPVAPASVASISPLAVSFPITGGDDTSMIDHSGGLSLTDNGTTVTLANFVIDVPGSVLTGAVTANNATTDGVTLFNIGSGADLTISSALAGDLTSVYGLPDLTGASLGTASIMATGGTSATPEPASFALFAIGLLGAGLTARKCGQENRSILSARSFLSA